MMNHFMDLLALEKSSANNKDLSVSRLWPTENKFWKEMSGKNIFSKEQYKYSTAELDNQSELFKHLKEYVYRTSDRHSYDPKFFEGSRLLNAKKAGEILNFSSNEIRSKMGSSHGVRHQAAPGCIEITKIEAVKNDPLWKNYHERREKVRVNLLQKKITEPLTDVDWAAQSDSDSLPSIDEKVGECWVFHGTTPKNIELIKQEGFKCRVNRPDGFFDLFRYLISGYGALGAGTYCSDEFGKVFGYTPCSKCGRYCECVQEGEYQEGQFLICRAVLGKPYVTDRKETRHNVCPPKGYDSTVGNFDVNEILIPKC